MKTLGIAIILFCSIFLFECSSKNEDKKDVTPKPEETIETLKMHLDSTGQFYMDQYDFSITNKFSSIHLETYFPEIKKSQGHTLYLTLTTPEECRERNMACSQNNNVKIDLSQIEIITDELPKDKYAIGSFGGIFLKANGVISIYTIDKSLIFSAKTETKNYKVNRIELVIGTTEWKHGVFGNSGHILPRFYSGCGTGEAGQTQSGNIFENKFMQFWSKDDGSNTYKNGRTISLRTTTELKKMLETSANQTFSIVTKGCKSNDFFVSYLFKEKVTLN